MLILHPETNFQRFNLDSHIIGLKNLISDSVNYLLSKNIGMEQIKLLEIGVFNGESTFMFSTCIKHIVTIDPFLSGYDDNDGASRVDMNKVKENFMYLNGANILSEVITHFSKTSDEYFADTLYRKDFDMVYIDGCHTYEQVNKDIKHSTALNPYIISGHDFTFETIQKALTENFPNTYIKSYEDGSWMIPLK